MHATETARRLEPIRQQTFAEEGLEKFRKKTRKEQLRDEMERIIPWQELTAAIKPFYPNPQSAGRWASSGCCGSTSSSIGSTGRIPTSS
ncbi:MAG: hypothetical protein AB7I68_13465 [Porticoccaceae bacterium]